MRGHVLAPALVIALATASTAAADRLLFESYVGNRPAEAARVAPLIRAVFERHGFVTDPMILAMMFREHAYRPGIAAPYFAETLKRTEQRAEELFWNEKYLKIIEELGNLFVAMRENSLIFAKEPKYRETALHALVFYALACGRQAQVLADKPQEAARFEQLRDDTLAEIMRSYPSKIFTKKEFGDEGVKLLSRARDKLNTIGRGRVSITTSDHDALVYLDEIAQGTGKADVGDLIPGVYRVLIVVPSGEARQYEIEVTANQTSRLVEDWDLDSLLVLSSTYAGFKYPTEKEHALEATIVNTLAQAHANASIAATITIAYTRGRFAVTGTSYNTSTGQIFHSGHVELTGSPSNDTMINRLAQCLIAAAGETCAEGVLPVSHPEFTPPPLPAKVEEPAPALPQPSLATTMKDSADAARSWPKWIAAGSSAALLAVSAYSIHKTYDLCTCTTYSIVGYGALDVGAALGALSIYWFYDPELSHVDQLPAKWFALGGATAIAVGAGLYAIDEDPTSQKKHYRDTAPGGVALGMLGLASVGTGLWIWRHNARAPTMPSVSLSTSRATLAWGGVF